MIRDLIKKEIEKAVKKVYPERSQGIDFSVSVDGRFGDYSSNAAMVLAKDFKKEPMEIANNLKSQISNLKSDFLEKVEIAGPGFLNFTLSGKGLIEGLKNVRHRVSNNTRVSNKTNKRIPSVCKGKIQVEFISANPTGELHIGHGRSAFYGDALANILKVAGYKVEKEFYINDSKESIQIRELGKTILGKGTSYLTKNLKSQISNLKFQLENLKEESETGYLIAQQIQKDNQKFIEKELKIKFDKWFSEEKDLRKKTAFKKTLDLLKKKKLTYEKDRAIWLKTSQFSDDADRVIVRSSGEYTYFLSDIAYHINKFGRKYDKIIDIWGADHHSHVKRMVAVKKMLNWEGDLKVLISQLVTLKRGEELEKLSKRKGNVILLKDLVDDLGLDAVRWFYLEKSLSTHMDFDLDLAKEHSVKNPVYYVQYAGARMYSILAKSEARNTKFETIFKSKIINLKPVRNLIVKLIQFPEVVDDTANDYQIQRLTTYTYELAKEFSQFYENVKVIGSEDEKELIALVALTRKILADALNLLGISTPEKM